MTILIALSLGLLVSVLLVFIGHTMYHQGRLDGYEDGCRDCLKGVIPQHERPSLGHMEIVKVWGADGEVKHAAPTTVHVGTSPSLRLVPAEDDPRDGA